LENVSTPFKLVIFDLDGVLVPIDSSWQCVHRAFGKDNEENYRKYLMGEIDYEEFMRSDIALWEGASIGTVQAILDKVPLAEGARETVETLRENRIRTAIVSSGISLLADRIGRELGIDRVYANKLIADDSGQLTGEGVTIVSLKDKLSVVRQILEEERASPQECAIVGDSVFDFPDFGDIGLSIALNPQDEESKVKADVLVEGKDLRLLLPWLTSGPPSKITIRLATGEREARSVVAALSPDNIKVPQGLYVGVFQEGRSLYVKIVSVRGLGTLLATADDVLSCSQVAVSSINVASLFKGPKLFK
jgi:phosphoserine phosphatase